MIIHELRDENGNVIHACATASFPLPENHWIYQEPVEPDPLPDAESEVSHEFQLKAREALRYTIQVCTSRGKDMDFDPDAMLMTFRNTLLGIGKSLSVILLVLFAVPCYAQESSVEPYVRYGSQTARWNTNPPKVYSWSGAYLGELSQNRYRPDSISNPYGQYGSRYSPTSINNPYQRYSTQPVYVYPTWSWR